MIMSIPDWFFIRKCNVYSAFWVNKVVSGQCFISQPWGPSFARHLWKCGDDGAVIIRTGHKSVSFHVSQTRAQTKSSDRRHLCSKHTMWNMCKAIIARKNWPPFCHSANSCTAITIDNWGCWRWFLAHWNIALESCKTQSAPNERYNFPKMRVGVKGRLEFFRKFIRFCSGTLP